MESHGSVEYWNMKYIKKRKIKVEKNEDKNSNFFCEISSGCNLLEAAIYRCSAKLLFIKLLQNYRKKNVPEPRSW